MFQTDDEDSKPDLTLLAVGSPRAPLRCAAEGIAPLRGDSGP